MKTNANAFALLALLAGGRAKMNATRLRCDRGPLPGAWSRKALRAELEPFARVYAQRLGGSNLGGAGFFHYFAIWVALRHLRPRHVVESGCHRGVGSWFLRKSAGASAQMTFLSPAMPAAYIDRAPDSAYLTGRAFRDFSAVPWELRLPSEAARGNETVIFFDDHQAALRRAVEARRFGFRHLLFDDNYLPGAGDNFALKQVCNGDTRLWRALRPGLPIKYADNFGRKRRPLDSEEFGDLARLYAATVEAYFEFPPPWLGSAPNRFGLPQASYLAATKRPLLTQTEARQFAASHGLDFEGEALRYTHIVYARLREGKLESTKVSERMTRFGHNF